MSAHERGPGGLLADLAEIAAILEAIDRSLGDVHAHLSEARARIPSLARDLESLGGRETISGEEVAVLQAQLEEAERRATAAEARFQNASAFARDMGHMKLTDAPPSTQSISTSLRPWISRSPIVSRQRMFTWRCSRCNARTCEWDCDR